jgi:hypothetical protein
MALGPRRISAVSILVGIVMLLVPALAWMQYQWLGQLSEAERERMQRTLRTAAAQFATEFDTELSRTLVSLQVDGVTIRDQNWTSYAQRYSAWATSSSVPRAVRDVWLVDTLPGTPLAALDGGALDITPDRLRLRQWNTQTLTFEETAWPDDLVKLRDSLAARFIGFQVRGRVGEQAGPTHREASVTVSLGDDTTLISPVTLFELPADHRGPPRISILGFTIIRLDPVVIRDTMLSSLTARHFRATDDDVNYRIAVVQREDASQVVWESEPGAAQSVVPAPDVTQAFMGPRPDQMFIFARGLRGDAPPPPPPPPPSPGSRDQGAGSGNSEAKVVVSMVEREQHHADGHAADHAGGSDQCARGPLGADGPAPCRVARSGGGGGALAQPDGEFGRADAAHAGRRPDRRVRAARAGAGAAADGVRGGGVA